MKLPEIINEYRPSGNEIFYYYCSANTFLNIISCKKELWLSDLRHMNDSSELLYGEELFVDCLKNSPLSEKEQKEVHAIYKEFYSRIVLLAICFSTSGEILSQWRGYADDAKGFCIGFNADQLCNLPFCPLKVIYEVEEQKNLMHRIIDQLIPYIKNLNVDKKKLLYLIAQLINVFAQVKHPSFHEEKEFRLTHALTLKDDGTLTDDVKEICIAYNDVLKDIDFRLVNNIPIPYIKINTPKTDGLIKEVIIGSKNQSEISDIKMFLAKNGYKNVKVRKDLSPYV